MAEYVRLRASALKAGVGLALAALIGGLPARAQAATHASAAKSENFLKLGGLSGNVKTSFLKLELKYLKIDSALGSLEHKLAKTYYSAHKLNTSFLKIKSADSTFLKIDNANSTFLKIDDASSQFLKIDDANTQFLRAGATAVNSNELGGATTESFSRSSTGEATIESGGPDQTLLATPEGVLKVTVGYPDNPVLTITNGSGSPITAVLDRDGQDTPLDIPANSTSSPITMSGDASQIHVQFFLVPGLFFSDSGEPATLIVSSEQTGASTTFVGQLIAGAL